MSRVQRKLFWCVFLACFILVVYVASTHTLKWPHDLGGNTASPRTSSTQQRVGTPGMYPPKENAGEIDRSVTQANIDATICVHGYTSTVRPPVSYTNRIKRQRLLTVANPGSASDYELDHVIPLELGGCPDCPGNLWLESYDTAGAKKKDKVENYLHREVCRGHMPLAQAQRLIMDDWYAIYLQIEGEDGR